nr:zinc finger, CCHC-type [Tanacetum cinerariifolium]
MAIDYTAGGRPRKLRPEVVWEPIKDLAQYNEEGWNDPVVLEEESLDYKNHDLEQLLEVMDCKEAFKDLVMNFILDQEKRVKQLEEYMGLIRSDFMQKYLNVVEKLKDDIRAEENRVKKIEKITRYPEKEDLKPSSKLKFLETLAKSSSSHAPEFILPKLLYVKYVCTIFLNPPLVKKSSFGFKPVWETIKDLAQYKEEGWNDPIVPKEESLDYKNHDLKQLLEVMKCKEAFKDLVINFILDQEERVKELEEYIRIIRSDFMQQYLKVVEKLKDDIRAELKRIKKIEKITSPPLVEKSSFGFKPGINNNQNIKSRYDVENSNPQCTPQVLPSFEENTPPVTYSNEVEEIIGMAIEVEPLNETSLENLGLNSLNHDIPLSFGEIPNFDEPELQPQPLPSCPSLDISLGEERSPKRPIKPYSPDSFRMKVVDNLTMHIPPSPNVASFYP